MHFIYSIADVIKFSVMALNSESSPEVLSLGRRYCLTSVCIATRRALLVSLPSSFIDVLEACAIVKPAPSISSLAIIYIASFTPLRFDFILCCGTHSSSAAAEK